MIISKISFIPELDPILFSGPAPLKKIISDPGGSGSGSTTLIPDIVYRVFQTVEWFFTLSLQGSRLNIWL
jgi:hypothetical protein